MTHPKKERPALPKKRPRGRPHKYPWDALPIGGSFTVHHQFGLFYKQAAQAERRYGKTFVAEDIGDGCTRITRTA